MTNTYMIHAWCMRPFIATIDIEADTPEEAINKARTERQWLFDTAEECNRAYPWDEFAAYDEKGYELLRVLDDEARLREAAPVLRETLVYMAQMLAGFKPDFLRQIGLDVALEQVEQALAVVDNTSLPTAQAEATDDQD